MRANASNSAKFSQIYLETIGCGRSVFVQFDVTTTTKFWQQVFEKLEYSFYNNQITFLKWISFFFYISIVFPFGYDYFLVNFGALTFWKL